MNLTATELTRLPTAEGLAQIHAEAIGAAYALSTGYIPAPSEIEPILARLAKSILNSYMGYHSSLPEVEAQIARLFSTETQQIIRSVRDRTILAVELLEQAKLKEAANVQS